MATLTKNPRTDFASLEGAGQALNGTDSFPTTPIATQVNSYAISGVSATNVIKVGGRKLVGILLNVSAGTAQWDAWGYSLYTTRWHHIWSATLGPGDDEAYEVRVNNLFEYVGLNCTDIVNATAIDHDAWLMG